MLPRVSPPRLVTSLIGCASLMLALACGRGDEPAPPSTPDEPRLAAKRQERPLPAFEGYTLEGERLSVSSLVGKRLLLFFFNPEVEEARPVAGAVGALAAIRDRYNFEIAGVAVGSNGDRARRFASDHGLDFPIIDDSSGRITSRLRLSSPVLLIGADPEGYMSFVSGSFPTDAPDAAHRIEQELRAQMRIPTENADADGNLLDRPQAPVFSTPLMDGGDFHLAEHRGKPIILVFFLHTCPHCHHALGFLKEVLPKIPEDKRPLLYGISVVDRPATVRSAMREAGLDYFPILRDPGEKLRSLYGAYSGVPDLIFIDAEGGIAFRTYGWRERDEALVRMTTHKLAGDKIPMLLARSGYTGNDVCGVCHELEARSWQYTSHASAYDTLVTHGVARDGECVSCHVVGFGQTGGFDMNAPLPHLEDVGCESCHGRGGPHLSPDFVRGGDYASVCETCHNAKHSLGFEYATFRPNISHTAIAALPAAERAALSGGGKPRDVLPTLADHVGSDACQSCHASEYTTWAASPHAHSIASLEAQGKAGDADCQPCHTTALGKTGGFPAGAPPADHADLARVGCESCHGPGGDHVAEGASKRGSIVSLGDKCDSCVILQICGSCHDHANDKDFEFSVQEHIDRQRHGTIEAGTGKPLAPAALLDDALRTGIAQALAAHPSAAAAAGLP
jgi:peroxiredoxin